MVQKRSQNNYLEVPTRQQRNNIIKHEHLLGNFQTGSVYKAIAQKYYWPKMRDDINHFIQWCVPCDRNHQVPMKEHSAKAMKLVGLFYRYRSDFRTARNT